MAKTKSMATLCTGLELALDEQREALFTATALVDTLKNALQFEFGEDWPAKFPEFPRVLQQARTLIDKAAGALEYSVLLERGHALAGTFTTAEVARAHG